jgi:hypothetical protein
MFLQLPKNLEYEMILSATERSRTLAEIIAYCLLLTVIKLTHTHDAYQFYFISSYIKDLCICLAKALFDIQHILDDILGVLFYALDPTRKLHDHFSRDFTFFEEFKANLYDLTKLNEFMGQQKLYDISSWTGEKIRYIRSTESRKLVDRDYVLKVAVMNSSDFRKLQDQEGEKGEGKKEGEEAWGEKMDKNVDEGTECKPSSSPLKREQIDREDRKIVEEGKKKTAYTCKFCGQICSGSKLLSQHVRSACKNVGEEALQKRIRHNCEYCKKPFSRNQDLNRHIARKFKCH